MKNLKDMIQEGYLSTEDSRKEIKLFNQRNLRAWKILKVDDDHDIYTTNYKTFVPSHNGPKLSHDLAYKPIAIQPQEDGSWKICLSRKINGITSLQEYDIKKGYLRKAIECIRMCGDDFKPKEEWIEENPQNLNSMFSGVLINYRPEGDWSLLFKKYFDINK